MWAITGHMRLDERDTEAGGGVINSFTPMGADMRPVFFRAPLEISNFSNTHPLT